MRIDEHVIRAGRIERSMARKLDRDADYEMVIEACMLAGTNHLNAALHHRGITAAEADLLHSDKPPLAVPVPADIAEMMAALKVIEDMRPGYLRGDRPWSPADGDACAARLARVREIADGILKAEKVS